MNNRIIIVYGTTWCGDCHRARKFFEKNGVDYEWVNIDLDKNGERVVLEVNNGNRSVPTIIFEDGSILVEPSTVELLEKMR